MKKYFFCFFLFLLFSNDEFTINFNNIPITEFVKFVSQHSKINFLYNESELNFAVSIVSSEEITDDALVGTLGQVLKIHGFSLTQENGNFIIYQVGQTKPIANVFTDKDSLVNAPPIITKVFKINGNIQSIFEVINSMISPDAILQMIKENNQLILTDLTSNVSKITQLINSLESFQKSFFYYHPIHIPLFTALKNIKEITKNLSDSDLENESILEILKNVKIQENTNSLLFVGNSKYFPEIRKILESVDSESQQNQLFIYTLKNVSKESVDKYLKNIIKHLNSHTPAEMELKKSLKTANLIPDSNKILFLVNLKEIPKLQELLENFDANEKKITFYIYKLKNVSGNVIEENLDAFADKLKENNIPDLSVIEVLEKAKWIKETNSIILSGDDQAINKVKNLIDEYDVPDKEKPNLHGNFLIYHPVHVSSVFLEKSLKELAINLQKAKLADPDLINTIETAKISEITNSISFTGNSESITKLKQIIATIDIEKPKDFKFKTKFSGKYLIYKPKYVSGPELESQIFDFIEHLKKSGHENPAFFKTLKNARWDEKTQTLIFSGDPEVLDEVKQLLILFDIPTKKDQKGKITEIDQSSFLVYKLQYHKGDEIQTALRQIGHELVKSEHASKMNQDLLNAINSIQWIQITNTILCSGDSNTMSKLKELIQSLDIPLKQVFIEMLVLETSFTNLVNFGLDWGSKTKIDKFVAGISNSNMTGTTQPTATSSDSSGAGTSTNITGNNNNTNIVPASNINPSDEIPPFTSNGTTPNSTTTGSNTSSNQSSGTQLTPAGGTLNGLTTSENASTLFMQGLSSLNRTTKPNSSMIPFANGFDLGIIGDVLYHKGHSFLSLGSFIQALQTDNESSVVMTPKLITQDSKTSTIFIGQNIPYLGSQTSITGASNSTTNNLEYRDIGMNLSLTPILGNSDIVTLDINLERSLVDSTAPQTNTSVQGVTTSKSTMQTTVHIPDKCFLVLSGMVSDSKQRGKSGIPCLGGVSMLGLGASQNNRSDNRQNIVIFIRPHIINSYEDMTKVTEVQEDYFRENAGSPILEREFEENVESFKSYEIDEDEE